MGVNFFIHRVYLGKNSYGIRSDFVEIYNHGYNFLVICDRLFGKIFILSDCFASTVRKFKRGSKRPIMLVKKFNDTLSSNYKINSYNTEIDLKRFDYCFYGQNSADKFNECLYNLLKIIEKL